MTIEDSGFTGNQSDYAGGAIAIQKYMSTTTPRLGVKDSIFTGNDAVYAGGAIFTFGVSTTVRSSSFSANVVSSSNLVSSAQGGAIGALAIPFGPGNADLSLTIADSRFTGNAADVPSDTSGTAAGGAVFSQVALSVARSTFSGNTAEGYTGEGGAIADQAGTQVTITASSFLGNQAMGTSEGLGGAIFEDIPTSRSSRAR